MTHPQTSTQAFVVGDSTAGVVIARRGAAVSISFDEAETPAVRRAVADLARDLELVSGADVDASAGLPGAGIVVGTVGVSAAVDAAIASGALDISGLRDDEGALRWEAFGVIVSGETLYLVGADRRGTIYAIYDFLEAIGVSPWYWWGEVPVRPREHVTLAADTHAVDWPSVQLRGVFINDEEELFHWSRTHTADDTIGPETYGRVFELILRLKGNYLWPAMHVGAFNHDPDNGRLAHEMGIVIGTSHCDMLLRSNEHEFRPWVREQGEDIRYDYSIPGRNREKLQEYWRGSVEQNGDYEVTWTVGIRGVHDTGFSTAAIDTDGSLSEEDKLQARVELLENAIRDQRAILADTLGSDASAAPQLFVPYKEVLPLYDAGLDLPEDVTLVWANDNFGYIRRFPDENELQRSGGHGLYYHASYWSNFTTSYLATGTAPLALMKSELRRAWKNGIRRLWVDNIGGLKPLEIEMEYFLRSAWEAGRETVTADVDTFVAQWIDAAFTGGIGEEAGKIYSEYCRVNQQRKIEHLAAGTFAQHGWGDEASRRLATLRRLYDETNALLEGLPADERDAFFQVFALKIHMSYLTNAQFLYADRSALATRQGKPAAADQWLEISRAFDDAKRSAIHFYNHVMSDGRWDGMFTPEAFPPPVMPLFPATSPAVRIEGHGLGVSAWGDDPASATGLTFWPHGTSEKWIDVHSTGIPGVPFTIEADPWITLSARNGIAGAETRIAVGVDAGAAAGRTGSIRVSSPATGDRIEIPVHVAPALELPAEFVGAIEADGAVSMDPAHPDAGRPGARSAWRVVPHLGRDGVDALQAVAPIRQPDDIATTALAEFGFHLRTAGAHVLELHRLPTLDSTGRIRVAVTVDHRDPIVVESPTTDEHRGVWSDAIQDNVERLTVTLPHLDAGPHVLGVHVIDDAVTLTKLVVLTDAASPVTNLGAPFSAHTHRPVALPADPDPNATHLDEVERVSQDVYHTSPADLGLLDQVYADRHWWSKDTTFRRTRNVAQPRRGAARDWNAPDGSKDVVAALGAGRIVGADGVIAFEAEYSLAGSEDAWTTPSTDARALKWAATQAETDARTGLAMHVQPRGLRWDDPSEAPGLHFAIDAEAGGAYRVWLLLKFDDNADDSCVIALDGVPQPLEAQFSGGELCTYGTRQVWLWAHISDLDIDAGQHVLSVLARKSGLRIDRVYLTLGDELPPVDAEWQPSGRSAAAVASALPRG